MIKWSQSSDFKGFLAGIFCVLEQFAELDFNQTEQDNSMYVVLTHAALSSSNQSR
jgi:hypothetical protein